MDKSNRARAGKWDREAWRAALTLGLVWDGPGMSHEGGSGTELLWSEDRSLGMDSGYLSAPKPAGFLNFLSTESGPEVSRRRARGSSFDF